MLYGERAAIFMLCEVRSLGLTGVAGGLEGYMVTNMNPIQRILAVVGGLCLIIPGTVTDLAGIAIVGASVIWQLAAKKKRAAA